MSAREPGNQESASGSADAAAESRFEIVNNLGLHARAATKLVQLASQYACDIEIGREGQKANAKSVMGVLLLCGAKGTMVLVKARGPSAREAVDAIGQLIAAKFGESA
jgi:phosphocarrier protein HPr